MVVLEIAPLLRRNQSTAIIESSFGEWIAQFRLALHLDVDDETNGSFRIRRQYFKSRVESPLATHRRPRRGRLFPLAIYGEGVAERPGVRSRVANRPGVMSEARM